MTDQPVSSHGSERVTLWRDKSGGPWQVSTGESQLAATRQRPDLYEVRTAILEPDEGEQEEERVDWRAKAVAHARALVSMLSVKEVWPGTFGAEWLREAKETVGLDLMTPEFAAGHEAANKDGTLPDEGEVRGERVQQITITRDGGWMVVSDEDGEFARVDGEYLCDLLYGCGIVKPKGLMDDG